MAIWTPVSSIPAGAVMEYAGSSAPTGFLLCDGTSYLRADYADLFAVIGTTYGSADGTHFNVPNTTGRVVVGYDAGETEFDALAETGGAKTVKLTAAESGLPAHTHEVYRQGYVSAGGSNGASLAWDSRTAYNANSQALANSAANAASAHNNLQPYIVMNHIIKT